jgi:hypothetical protein
MNHRSKSGMPPPQNGTHLPHSAVIYNAEISAFSTTANQLNIHCPKNKADFRENRRGSPLEEKFSSNPWK